MIYIDLVGEENANSFESNSVSSYESSQLVFSSVLEGISLIEKKFLLLIFPICMVVEVHSPIFFISLVHIYPKFYLKPLNRFNFCTVHN